MPRDAKVGHDVEKSGEVKIEQGWSTRRRVIWMNRNTKYDHIIHPLEYMFDVVIAEDIKQCICQGTLDAASSG